MTIKLLLLKSGEDMIADVKEMSYGEDDSRRVVGYYLNKPCVIKMRDPNTLPELQDGKTKKAGFEVSLFPWIPLSAEDTIPIPTDWVVTIVNPAAKLKEMYIEDIVNYGKNNQSNSSDEQSDSDQSD
jgi:hypothetical protein|tara:strand:+ start:233 stop:613 length:381 start_codon:yes stop_codon:yes gene_type:complete